MRHVRRPRRAGVLLLAAMVVAGCSADGGGGGGSAESQEEGSSSSSSDGGADGSDEATDGEDEATAANEGEFSEETGVVAIEAVVPTSQVMGTDEVYAAIEKTLAQFEERDFTDTCTDPAKEQYELQLEARKPMVQGVVPEDAVLEPGADESVFVSATTASPELDDLRERQNEDCLVEGDELSTEETPSATAPASRRSTSAPRSPDVAPSC